MRVLKFIVWGLIETLPLWIIVAICVAYIALLGWLPSWVMSFDPAAAILVVAPIGAVLLLLALRVGGKLLDSESLQAWCDKRAQRVLPAKKASTRGN